MRAWLEVDVEIWVIRVSDWLARVALETDTSLMPAVRDSEP